jgi:hypothetical protein
MERQKKKIAVKVVEKTVAAPDIGKLLLRQENWRKRCLGH